MVSLCGLALSSLFVINNKSVVHADTANANQNNNAITWDSDQDDSQVVQSSQTKTEQAMPQKADDNQQNVQSVNANHAEIATVTSSPEQNNRTDAKTAQDAPVQAKQKVASVQATQAVNPVVIKNPAGNKVHVNWVNSKDETIPNANGYDIDLTKVGTQSEYHWIPDGYHLIKNGNFNITKNTRNIPHDAVTHRAPKTYSGTVSWSTNEGYGNQYATIDWSDGTSCSAGSADYYPTWTSLGGFSGNTHGLSHYDLQEIVNQAAEDIDGDTNGFHDAPFTYKANDQMTTVIDKPAYNETVTDYTFIDNSGAVLKQSGNTINVALIKPQHVGPATDARMRATATRTIQINFPGSIPPSYKNIVNDKGVLTQTVTFMRTGQEDALTGNLIDNTLSPWKSDNKDPNFIGFEARTLPRIPGYTLSIKPV